MILSFYDYKAYAGTATDALQTIMFAFKSRAIEITAINNPIVIKLLLADGVTFGDDIVFDPTTMAFPYPIPFQTTGFQVRNETAGVNGDYQVVEYV